MLPNRSLWSPPTSGFVPFSPAGSLDDDVVVDAPPSARRALDESRVVQPAADAVPALHPGMRLATWQPDTTARVRRVEMAVLAAVCGYFTFGLGKLLGLL